MAISGSCTFLVLNGPRVGSLLFLMSVFYCHTCCVANGSRVTSSLDYVSYFYWSHGRFLFDHVSRCYPSMFHFLSGHVAWWLPSTCQIFISPRVVPWLFHVSCTGSSTCRIFIWSHGLSKFYRMEYNQFVIKVIRDHHYCIDWQHNYSRWQSNTNN